MNEAKKRVVAVSGGFDPIHFGHIRYIQESKKLGDELVVILNNDNWLKDKKGFAFMPERERKEIIEGIAGVDRVVLTDHAPGEYFKDRSVCRALRQLRPDVFSNGGDRKPEGDPVPEVALCRELGIELIYNVGREGKVQSSSWLIASVATKAQENKTSGPKLVLREVAAPIQEVLSPLSPWSKAVVVAFVTLVVLIGTIDIVARIDRVAQSSNTQTVEAATQN